MQSVSGRHEVNAPPIDATAAPPPVSGLFRGGKSVRWPRENRMLVICVLFAPLTIGLVTFALHEQLAGPGLAILVVAAFAYTAMARGRLLGTSVRVHDTQLPRVFNVVESCTKMLGVSLPLIFVREDLRVPLVAVGLREPYSLIVSTVWLTQLADDELTFLVGRELGHIYARHTRLTSLLSSAGSDNPILGFVMGPWLRRTEYTADRVGLLCCGESNAATRAILTTQFQNVANAIDPKAFLEQREEIEGDSSLRIGEWISREPYATHRIHQLRSFEASALFAYWRGKLKAYARVVNPVTYRERNRTALLAVLLLDGALIVSLANYLHVSKAIVVNATDLNVPPFLHLAAKHGTWLGGLLGPHPSAEALSDALTTAASFILSLIVYSGIAVVLHGTPGMLVFSVGRRNLGTTKN